MIKFTSNMFSLLVISGIALFVQAVLGAPDTDLDGSLLFDPPRDPASSRHSGSFEDHRSPSLDVHGNEIGKKQENSFVLVSPHLEPWKRRPQLELWKYLSMTKGSGTGLGQIKRGPFIFAQLVPCKM